MMTSAALLGIDSCPMEGFDLDKVTEILAEENVVDTEHFAPSVMVAFGYRKEEPKIKFVNLPKTLLNEFNMGLKRVKTLFLLSISDRFYN